MICIDAFITKGGANKANEKETAAAMTRRVVEDMFRLGKEGEIEKALALLDEKVEIYEPPFLPYGGKYVGRDGFVRLFSLIQEKYFDDLSMRVQYIAVEGEYAIAINHVPGLRGETVVLAEEMRVRDGKIIEIRIYLHQAPAVELRGPAAAGTP